MGQAALKTEPASELLSISEIGRRCGIKSRETTRKRLDDLGYKPEDVNPDGPNATLYRFDEEMLLALKSAKTPLDAMRLREMRARAEKIELQNAEARRELVPMHEVVDIVQKIGKAIYVEFTERQPKRIAPKLAKAKNVTTVRQIQKADTDRVMKILRENFEGFIA